MSTMAYCAASLCMKYIAIAPNGSNLLAVDWEEFNKDKDYLGRKITIKLGNMSEYSGRKR